MTVEELMKYMLNLFNNTSDNLHNEYENLSKKPLYKVTNQNLEN